MTNLVVEFQYLEGLTLEITPKVTLTLLRLQNWQSKQYIQQGELEAAFRQLEKTLDLQPNYADGLYNAGIIGFQVEQLRKTSDRNGGSPASSRMSRTPFLQQTRWREYLNRFLQIQPDHRYAWVAKRLLEGEGLPAQVSLAL